jgi:hypothetical protein
MLRIEPFTVKDELTAKHRFQYRTLHRSPLFEEIILRVHPLRDLVPATLQHHASARREMNADVRAVNLLFGN